MNNFKYDKKAYKRICNELIRPYLNNQLNKDLNESFLDINLEESYLGYDEGTELYFTGWDGFLIDRNGNRSNTSIVFPLKYNGDEGIFIIVSDKDDGFEPIHIHDFLLCSNDYVNLSSFGLYDEPSGFPNLWELVCNELWEDYSQYNGIIKELRVGKEDKI